MPPSGGYFVSVMNNFSQITDDEIGFLSTIQPTELSEADVDRMAAEQDPAPSEDEN